MQFNIRNLFARQQTVTSDGKTPATGLFEEEAASQLVRLLTKVPDLDEVLKQAGIKRGKLRVLLFDDEIAQACETRQDALLAVPVRLEPSEGPAAEFLERALKPVLRDAVGSAFQARLFGYSVLEAVYKYDDEEPTKIVLSYLGEKPFEWFEPKPDGRLVYFPDDGSGGGEGIEVDQKFKFFLTRSRATYRQPYGEALLSRLYWPWFFRTNGWRFWAKFLERFGSPLLVGKSTKPGDMVKALLLAHSQAVIGIDREDSVEAVGASGSNTGQAFVDFESAAIRRIQKVVLGQTLTSGTDGGSGNRALGQVHDAVRTDKRDSDVAMVRDTIQRVVDALCLLNKLPKHEVVFADEVGLEADRAKRDKDLHDVGVRFEKSYFEDNYDLRGEDFSLSSEAADPSESLELPEGGGSGNPPGGKGDARPAPNPRAGAKAGQTPPRFSVQFASGGVKFTKKQQVVEGEVDEAEDIAGSPLGDAVRKAVLAATSPEDLQDRLFALIGEEVSREDFKLVTERALFAADVLGYVHAEGKV